MPAQPKEPLINENEISGIKQHSKIAFDQPSLLELQSFQPQKSQIRQDESQIQEQKFVEHQNQPHLNSVSQKDYECFYSRISRY